MALIDDINALPTAVGDGQTGHLNNHSVIHAALKDHEVRLGARHLIGTGSPEGKITATIGTQYTDQAATSGAIRWIKTSGTGATGWKVESGDTGWRDITALMGDSVTGGQALIRRTNNTVWLNVDSLAYSATENYHLFSSNAIPLGFRVVSGWKFFNTTSRLAYESQGPLRVSYGGDLGLYDTAEKTSFVAYVSWPTENSWPATLPGTPA